MPHRPGHPEPGFRAAEATDEQIRRRQAELRRGRVRAATGNQTAANFLERAGRGLRGARERVTSAAGTAVEAAQNLAARTASRIRGGGADTTTRAQAARTRAPGLDVTFEQETRPGQRPLGGSAAGGGGGSAARRLGRLGLSALKFVPGGAAVGAGIEAGLAGDELLSRSEELGAASGIPEVTPLIGEQPAGQAPGAQAPVNLERTFDPLLAAARPIVGLARRTVPFAGDEEAVEQARAERQAQQPAGPAAGAAGGLREFTNIDAQRAAAGIDPASRRGERSVEENQAVIDRLIERNRGLRDAAPVPTERGRQADFVDPGRGIASAFGTLARSGNQLRREAAERGRAFTLRRDLQEQAAEAATAAAGRDIDIARFQQTAERDFRNQLGSIQSNFAQARGAGTEEQFLDSTARSASNNPNGPEAAFFGPIVGQEVRQLAGEGFLTALDPTTERGIFDWLASFGQGGQAQPLLTPEGQVTINAQTGSIEIVSPDGSTRQSLVDVTDLPPRSQEFLRAVGTQLSEQELANQPGDPTLRGRRALTLRDANR